jgi:hypothetical protein
MSKKSNSYFIELTSFFFIIGKEKKREIQQAAKVVKNDTSATIQAVLAQVTQDDYPTLTEEKEAYFMKQVSQGESLVAKGIVYIILFYSTDCPS